MMRARSEGIIVATTAPAERAREWDPLPDVRRVVALKKPSLSGRRFGKLALGLGLDALAVACKVRLTVDSRAEVLTTNPWIAVALRLLGHRDLASMGIYAAPGSTTWRIFWRLIPRCAMVVMSTLERDNWQREGGSAAYVRYGNSFPYPRPRHDDRAENAVRIFVGGSSDRDHALIARLASEVLESGAEVSLVVAVGGAESTERSGRAEVRWLGPLSQEEFGAELGDATLSFLPLEENGRSAGHMFIVGSLQMGTPVIYTETEGMREYGDPVFCRAVPRDSSPLRVILEAATNLPSTTDTHEFWAENYSREKFLESVVSASQKLRATKRAHD